MRMKRCPTLLHLFGCFAIFLLGQLNVDTKIVFDAKIKLEIRAIISMRWMMMVAICVELRPPIVMMVRRDGFLMANGSCSKETGEKADGTQGKQCIENYSS